MGEGEDRLVEQGLGWGGGHCVIGLDCYYLGCYRGFVIIITLKAKVKNVYNPFV